MGLKKTFMWNVNGPIKDYTAQFWEIFRYIFFILK